MDRWVLRRVMTPKCKRKRPKIVRLGKFWKTQKKKTTKKTGERWHEIKKERPWKVEKIGDFSSTVVYTMETMLEEYDTHNHVPLTRTVDITYYCNSFCMKSGW